MYIILRNKYKEMNLYLKLMIKLVKKMQILITRINLILQMIKEAYFATIKTRKYNILLLLKIMKCNNKNITIKIIINLYTNQMRVYYQNRRYLYFKKVSSSKIQKMILFLLIMMNRNKNKFKIFFLICFKKKKKIIY